MASGSGGVPVSVVGAGGRDGDSSVGWVQVGRFRLEGRGREVLVLVDAIDACIELESYQLWVFFE